MRPPFDRLRAIRQHIFNAGSLLVSKVLVYAAYFAAIPGYVHAHGQASYGVVAFFGTLIGYSVLLENGLSYAVTLRYTRALARNEEREPDRIVRAAVPIYGLLALTCALFFLTANGPLAGLIWGKQDYAGSLQWLGLAVALLVFDALFVSVIQAHNKLVALNMIRLAADGVRVAALYVAAHAEDPLRAVTLMFVASALLKLVLDAAYCFGRLVPKQMLRPLFDLGEAAANLRLAPMMIVTSMTWLVASFYDKTYAASHVSEHRYAYYALAADLTTKAHVLFYAILSTTYNVMIRYHATGKGVGSLLKTNGIALLVMTLLYYVPLALGGEWIIGFFLGAEFGAQAAPLIRILAGCSVTYLAFSCLEANLNAQGRAFAMMWIYLTGLAVLVALTPWLFGYFGLAGLGLSLLGMFSTMLALAGLLTFRLVER